MDLKEKKRKRRRALGEYGCVCVPVGGRVVVDILDTKARKPDIRVES